MGRGGGVNRGGAFVEYVIISESTGWMHSATADANLDSIFEPFGDAVHTALTYDLVTKDISNLMCLDNPTNGRLGWKAGTLAI